MKTLNPLWRIIDFTHMLTPLAIERRKVFLTEKSYIAVRIVYVFGIRIAYFNVTPF